MKLSAAQQRFMDRVDGKFFSAVARRERDGTVTPWMSEKRTVDSLVRAGLLKWVHAGKDGYTFNGVVRATPQSPQPVSKV